MAMPASVITEHEYLSNLRTQIDDVGVLETYYQAFPDEREFLQQLQTQHGDTSAVDTLLESLRPIAPTQVRPADKTFREGSMAQLREIGGQIEELPPKTIEQEEVERKTKKQVFIESLTTSMELFTFSNVRENYERFLDVPLTKLGVVERKGIKKAVAFARRNLNSKYHVAVEEAKEMIEAGDWRRINELAAAGRFPTHEELGDDYIKSILQRYERVTNEVQFRGVIKLLGHAVADPSSSWFRSGEVPHLVSDEFIRKHPKLAILPLTLAAPFEEVASIATHPEEWPSIVVMYVGFRYIVNPATQKLYQWMGTKGWATYDLFLPFKKAGRGVKTIFKGTTINWDEVRVVSQGIKSKNVRATQGFKEYFMNASDAEKSVIVKKAARKGFVKVLIPKSNAAVKASNASAPLLLEKRPVEGTPGTPIGVEIAKAPPADVVPAPTAIPPIVPLPTVTEPAPIAPITQADVAPFADELGANTIQAIQSMDRTNLPDDVLAPEIGKIVGKPDEMNALIDQHGATAVLDEIFAIPEPEPVIETPLDQWRKNKSAEKAAAVLEKDLSDAKAGMSIQTPPFKKGKPPTEPDIEDAATKIVIEAGEKLAKGKTGFKENLAEKGRTLKDWATIEFEPKLLRAGEIQLRDDYRTGAMPITSTAKSQTQMDFANIWGPPEINANQRQAALRIVALQDMTETMFQGKELPRNLEQEFTTLPSGDIVPSVFLEMKRMMEKASPEVLQAVQKYQEYANLVGEDLVRRGKMPPEALRNFYFPHRIVDYLPDWYERAPFLSRTLRDPYRYYTNTRKGSAKDIAISENALYSHFATVQADNMLDDWAIGAKGVLPKNDIIPAMTDAQKLEQFGPTRKPRPGGFYEIGDNKYRGFQYVPGRMLYTAEVADPILLIKGVEDALLEEPERVNAIFRLPEEEQYDAVMRYLQDVGPRGANALRKGLVVGQYNKVYVVSEPIYDKMKHFKDSVTGIPQIYGLGAITRMWKNLTLGPLTAGIPFQINNLMGDMQAMTRTSMGAIRPRYFHNAWNILRNLRPENRGNLNAFETKVLKLAEDKDIFGSGFLHEYSTVSPLMDVKSWFRKYNRLSGMRETFLRIQMLAYQMDRLEKGLPLHAPEFQNITDKLDPESGAGFIARNFGVDYAAVPDWWRKVFSGFALPFGTFWVKNAHNWALYAKYAPKEFVAKVLGAEIMAHTLNNTVTKGIESRNPRWVLQRFHLNLPFGIRKDEDDNPEEWIVWSPQLPHNMAAQWVGMDRLMEKIEYVNRGLMTPQEAAKAQLHDMGVAVPRLLAKLQGPMLQVVEGIASNKHPRTGRPIVPSELSNIPDEKKWRYRLNFMLETMVTPFGQFMRSLDSDEKVLGLFPETEDVLSTTKEYVTKGPLDWKRAFGFYKIRASQNYVQEARYLARRASGMWQGALYDLTRAYYDSDGNIPEFINSDAVQKVVADLQAQDIVITDDFFNSLAQRISAPSTQMILAKRRIRDAATKEEKEAAQKRYDQLIELSALEYAIKLPPVAKQALIRSIAKMRRKARRTQKKRAQRSFEQRDIPKEGFPGSRLKKPINVR